MKVWNGMAMKVAPFERRTLWLLDRHHPASPLLLWLGSLTMACERIAAGAADFCPVRL